MMNDKLFPKLIPYGNILTLSLSHPLAAVIFVSNYRAHAGKWLTVCRPGQGSCAICESGEARRVRQCHNATRPFCRVFFLILKYANNLATSRCFKLVNLPPWRIFCAIGSLTSGEAKRRDGFFWKMVDGKCRN